MTNIRLLPAKDALQLKAALDSIWPPKPPTIQAEACEQCAGFGNYDAPIGRGVKCRYCNGNGWKGGAYPFKLEPK